MRLILILLVVVSTHCSAQINSELITQLELSFQQFGDITQIKGLSVALRTSDDLWTDQYGVSGEFEPLNEDHLFAMGSVSKTITSATILQMYEEGLIDLEDQLGVYLESYENVDPTVTIRQMLNHTSGIYSFTSHPSLLIELLTNSEQIISPEDVISNFVLAPNFVAGTDFSYSNTNYVLLGMIIEEIAGQTYYEEARERFDFDNNYPSLAIPPFEISPDNLAHLWTNIDGTGVVDAQAVGYSLNLLFSGAGAAGAYAAAPKDLAQWARDLFSGDILQAGTMDEMLTTSEFTEGYGLGVILINGICSTNLLGHTGGIIYTSATFYDTQNDIAISLHTNDGDPTVDLAPLALELFCTYGDFITSVEEIEDVDTFELYPNPFDDHFTISYDLSLPGDVSLELLDQTGKSILRITNSKKTTGLHHEIVNQNLPAGMYILKIKLNNQITYKKVIKF